MRIWIKGGSASVATKVYTLLPSTIKRFGWNSNKVKNKNLDAEPYGYILSAHNSDVFSIRSRSRAELIKDLNLFAA